MKCRNSCEGRRARPKLFSRGSRGQEPTNNTSYTPGTSPNTGYSGALLLPSLAKPRPPSAATHPLPLPTRTRSIGAHAHREAAVTESHAHTKHGPEAHTYTYDDALQGTHARCTRPHRVTTTDHHHYSIHHQAPSPPYSNSHHHQLPKVITTTLSYKLQLGRKKNYF